jgi:hypothetical protein
VQTDNCVNINVTNIATATPWRATVVDSMVVGAFLGVSLGVADLLELEKALLSGDSLR